MSVERSVGGCDLIGGTARRGQVCTVLYRDREEHEEPHAPRPPRPRASRLSPGSGLPLRSRLRNRRARGADRVRMTGTVGHVTCAHPTCVARRSDEEPRASWWSRGRAEGGSGCLVGTYSTQERGAGLHEPTAVRVIRREYGATGKSHRSRTANRKVYVPRIRVVISCVRASLKNNPPLSHLSHRLVNTLSRDVGNCTVAAKCERPLASRPSLAP